MIEWETWPEELRNQVKRDVEQRGEWATNWMLATALLGRMVDDLQPTDTDTVWAVVALHTISFFFTKDPSFFHFKIARDFLQRKFEEDPADKAVDLLARELVKGCWEFSDFIQEVDGSRGRVTLPLWGVLKDAGGLLIPPRDCLPEVIYETDGHNLLDHIFAEYLKSIGPVGMEAAQKVLEFSRENKDFRPASWSLWITKKPREATNVASKFIDVILVEVIWDDRCAERWKRERALIPPIATGFWPPIKQMISKNIKVNHSSDKITVIGEDRRMIASMTVPYLDKKSLDLLLKGIESQSSLTGHRMYRWQIKQGCQNAIEGVPDPRSITIAGGYEEIANLIGCGKSPSRIAEVKSILTAQASFNFYTHNGDKVSSLIILKEIGYHRNGLPNKIQIILGDVLLPHALFSLPKNDQRRLIPVPDLPPLVGSPNTHSAQAMLQLLLLAEFSKQSDRFFEVGSILVSKSLWEEMAGEARLSISCLPKVLDGWSSNSEARPFLELNGEEVTLSQEHKEITRFLREQGEGRKLGSLGGKASAEKAAKKRTKF